MYIKNDISFVNIIDYKFFEGSVIFDLIKVYYGM